MLKYTTLKRMLVLFLVSLCFVATYILVFRTPEVHDEEIRIVRSIDVPGKLDKVPGKWVTPSGLAWDEQYLWSANWDSQRIYQVNPVTGEIVKFFSSPGKQPRGLAWDGQYLWNTDGQTRRIYRLNPSNGRTVRTLSLQRLLDSQLGYIWPGGLTCDGHYLWCSGGYHDEEYNYHNKIYKIDVSTLAVVFSFDSPGRDPEGLAWDGQYLWTDGWDPVAEGYTFYKLNPSTGEIVDSFDYPVRGSSGTWGLAWDGQYLWCVDWSMYKIYQLEVPPSPESPSPEKPFCLGTLAISSIIPVTLIVARVMKQRE